MQITFDPNDISDRDRSVIMLALGVIAPDEAAADTAPEPEPAKPARRTRKTAAAKAPDPEPEETPEDEPEDDDTDLIGGDKPGPTIDDVVTKATEVIRDKKKPQVAKLLKDYDVERVSELKPSQLAGFMDDLSAL